MGMRILKEKNINLQFNVKFIFCITTDEIKSYFDELNHDSERKPYTMQSDYFIYDLRNILENNYKAYFASTIKKYSHIYTINEFITILQDYNINKYIEKKKYIYAKELLDDIIKSNKKYNAIVNTIGYTELNNKHEESRIFYEDELKILKNSNYNTIAFKRNNFLINIEDDETKKGWFFRNKLIPIHTIYKERDKVSNKLKKEIWRKEFADDDDYNSEDEMDCPVYKCRNKISYNNCEMGHKKSRANGGTETKNNMRPICKECNRRMSDMDWKDYEKELKNIKKL